MVIGWFANTASARREKETHGKEGCILFVLVCNSSSIDESFFFWY